MRRSVPLRQKTPLRAKQQWPLPYSLRTKIGKTQKVFKTAKPARGNGEDALCRGQQCYLQLAGICCNDSSTVVPCHSNQSKHGKGMSLKANDKYTVPGCWLCHREIDQGMRFSREEKFAIWDAAYAKWEPVRDRLIGEVK